MANQTVAQIDRQLAKLKAARAAAEQPKATNQGVMRFHGDDLVALSGSDTIRAVANFIAVAQRGSNRDRLLTQQMRQLITETDDGSIIVSYLAFCDFLGQLTARHGVLLREVETKTILRKIRDIHGLRLIGLDVSEISRARMGKGDVMLKITNRFKSDADLIPDFFRDRQTSPSMEDILADAKMIRRAA